MSHPTSTRPRRRVVAIAALGLLVAAALGATWLANGGGRLTVARMDGPARSVVSDGGAWVATFTDGARTVDLAGPDRVFPEDGGPDVIRSRTWVRLLAAPFDGRVDDAWLAAERADRTPDVLAVAMEYVRDAAPVRDATGRQIAGDAGYGPRRSEGSRAEGSDFNDYLGLDWAYPDGRTEHADPDRSLDVDCSGFIRLVLGYRLGLPLGLHVADGVSLPRQSFEQAAAAPGIVLIPDAGTRPASLDGLQPGDLVFFDADPDDGPQIDHVGLFVGIDTAGHPRFISSRKTANGPTLGDEGGRATLDGDGLYATALRVVRRV